MSTIVFSVVKENETASKSFYSLAISGTEDAHRQIISASDFDEIDPLHAEWICELVMKRNDINHDDVAYQQALNGRFGILCVELEDNLKTKLLAEFENLAKKFKVWEKTGLPTELFTEDDDIDEDFVLASVLSKDSKKTKKI